MFDFRSSIITEYAIFLVRQRMTIGLGRRARAAGVVLAAMAGAAAGPVALSSPPRLTHAPIEIRRNLDGSPEAGLRNQWVSSNWSGYVVAKFQTGSKFTSAQMTWVVPAVTYGKSSDSTNSHEYSANWVGIGGFCKSLACSAADQTLIQLGTEQDVAPDGTTNYYAWYEKLPAAETPIAGFAVAPGDTITASLSCGGTCTQKKQTWALTMTNETTGHTWSKSVNYASSELSVEWIEEAPYQNGVLPLADFGTAMFPGPDGAYSVTAASNQIQMKDPWGQWADPSSVTVPNFNVCWGYKTFTPC
jgi:hypothetical protein